MGNYKFRFSWFHTSNKITKTQPVTTSSSSSSSSFQLSQPSIDQRKSYYFTRELTEPEHNPTRIPDPPRKSTKKKNPTSPGHHKLKSPELNLAAECGCQKLKSRGVNFPDDESTSAVQSGTCTCKTNPVIYGKVDLPRIITKPMKENEFGSGKWVIDETSRSLSVRVVKEAVIGSPVRKSKGNGYSPRLGNRVRVNGLSGGRRRSGSRRSLSESLAVVKTSVDPGRDFKESMVEMIMENSIKSSKDLEDLLACYLALNSDEYHDLIIKVFKQIWFESTDIRL